MGILDTPPLKIFKRLLWMAPYQLGAKSMIRKPQPHPRPKTLNFTCRWDKIGVLFVKPHPFQEEGNVCSFSNLRLIKNLIMNFI